jgi:hypothetical protein
MFQCSASEFPDRIAFFRNLNRRFFWSRLMRAIYRSVRIPPGVRANVHEPQRPGTRMSGSIAIRLESRNLRAGTMGSCDVLYEDGGAVLNSCVLTLRLAGSLTISHRAALPSAPGARPLSITAISRTTLPRRMGEPSSSARSQP